MQRSWLRRRRVRTWRGFLQRNRAL